MEGCTGFDRSFDSIDFDSGSFAVDLSFGFDLNSDSDIDIGRFAAFGFDDIAGFDFAGTGSFVVVAADFVADFGDGSGDHFDVRFDFVSDYSDDSGGIADSVDFELDSDDFSGQNSNFELDFVSFAPPPAPSNMHSPSF